MTSDSVIKVNDEVSSILSTKVQGTVGKGPMSRENNFKSDIKCDLGENYNISTQTSGEVNNTTYHCININDVPAFDKSNADDILYDFTTPWSRERLCVATDNKRILPFSNRVILNDNKTGIECGTYNQDTRTALTSKAVSMAYSEQELTSNSGFTKSNSPNASSCCKDSTHIFQGVFLTVKNSVVGTNTQAAVIITSCTSTNNTSQNGLIWIEYPNVQDTTRLSGNVLITSCSFTNYTIASLEEERFPYTILMY